MKKKKKKKRKMEVPDWWSGVLSVLDDCWIQRVAAAVNNTALCVLLYTY
jgi:hypothetical protein